MKQGLIFEDGELIYYKDDTPNHAGAIEVDGAIYYIGSGGRAVKGSHIVHGSMSNGILQRGTYTFGEDYKLIEGSYKAPQKKKKRRKLLRSSFSKGKKSSGRLRRFIKKNKKNVVISVGCISFMLVLCLGLVLLESGLHSGNNPSQSTTPTGGTNQNASIVLPNFTEDVVLCSAAAKSEYDGLITLKEAVAAGNPYRSFGFEYQFYGVSGTLQIGLDPHLTDAKEYAMPENGKVVWIDNLLVDTTYYYQVVVGEEVYNGYFHTAPSTRFVSIPGLVNTRDIGGGTNLNGQKIRQGLLIRGVELDGLVNPAYFMSTTYAEDVLNTFGFVFDMDLREPEIFSGNYVSQLGIAHEFYGSPQYGEIFNAGNFPALRHIFEDLADANNYPMYMHCTWGRDRTGTIVFLLQGILNVSEEDMLREYQLSGYSLNGVVGSNNMEVVISSLRHYEGATLQERIVTYLTTTVGVTPEQINAIRDIFLES